MSATLLGSYVAGSDEWHDVRHTRIGGSEASAIFGLNAYESKFSLYNRKLGLIPNQPEKPEMEWGKRLERPVLEKWLENHPEHTEHSPIGAQVSYLSDQYPWMLASPDLQASVPGGQFEVVEAKTSPMGDDWGPAGGDGYPVGYLIQLLHYMIVLDATVGHLCVLISGYDYREYTVRIEDFQDEVAEIIAAEKQFMEDLTNRVTPDIDAHSQTYEAVKQLHPDINPDLEMELEDERAVAYLEAVAAFKAAEDEKRKQSALVIDFIESAKYATHLGERIARRQSTGGAAPHLRSIPRKAKKEIKAA